MMRGYLTGFEPRRRRLRDRHFEELFRGFPEAAESVLNARPFPALNIRDAGEEFVAEAELPGMKADQVDISVVGSELTIRGERSETVEEGGLFHCRERRSGSFTRVLRLPVEINADLVKAELQHGVLTIHLPKAEAAKPRKISVQAN